MGSRKNNRVYFDWQQIGTGKTIAAPYVVHTYGARFADPIGVERGQARTPIQRISRSKTS